ncbi:S-adenosylmethionine decarboxylase [Cesiribacter sp. SM1]|uniref:S-adenosylmethionine decarboxylase n=1 Tax=Cesiribacter sp. SM1 TaxID=2861196 RepID=UPI001CD72345|nr:S-adenosylmethionine decarboxylase [Cesiribacter sp. SM1]
MELTATDTFTLIENYKTWVPETTPKTLRSLMSQWLEQCCFQMLNIAEHHFTPHGYTCLWLLGESHLAIHTFPEKNVCYVELTSCNAVKNQQFQSLLTAHFASVQAPS